MEGFDDDDFGELYAVDIEVPNAISEEEEEEKLDVNSNILNLDKDMIKIPTFIFFSYPKISKWTFSKKKKKWC